MELIGREHFNRFHNLMSKQPNVSRSDRANMIDKLF